MNVVLCVLSLALVPSAQTQSKPLAEKNAETERKAAELKRVDELQQAEVERILKEQSGPTGQRLAPPVQPYNPPAPAVTTVTVQVYTGGYYGGYGYGGYGVAGFGGFQPAFGYGVVPVYTTPRPVVATFPNRPMYIHPGVHNKW
ncbi:MAG TPA: hypothetical protein VMZ71_10695 [Gemmataceae bacterium]|nr:hypothetical protein [Gemmataceae bacterium]